MNRFQRIGVLLAVALLGGCAEMSQLTGKSDEVPIEERGAASTAGKAGAGKTGPVAAAAGGAAGSQIVETHALPAAGGSEGQAIPSATQTPAGGRSAIVGVTPEQAAMLSDPNNPLSKRIVYFDYDSDAIREEFRGLIEAHAAFLKNNGAARVILQGHTDERGSRDYNLALGQRRSESVRQALTLMGVQNEQLETVSLGEEKPVQEGHDEAAWKQNRRAEIHYLGE